MDAKNLPFSYQVALVVDDITSARIVLSDMLKELGFKTCLEAKDGTSALRVLETHSVDVIFCDFLMTGMNGLTFLKTLREQRAEKAPPVIFVSSIGDVENVENTLKLGASDYVVKPVNFSKLRRKLEALASKATESAQVR